MDSDSNGRIARRQITPKRSGWYTAPDTNRRSRGAGGPAGNLAAQPETKAFIADCIKKPNR